MLKLQSGPCTEDLLQAEGPVPCCRSRQHAASAGHYECYKMFPSYIPGEGLSQEYSSLRTALQHGHVAFASCLFHDRDVEAIHFARHCIKRNDAVSLQFVIGGIPRYDLDPLCYSAACYNSIGCVRVLLEKGVPWIPRALRFAAEDNRLDILELVLPFTSKWCTRVSTLAACLGHVRFLMRTFDAGCPIWSSAIDGEPYTEGGETWSYHAAGWYELRPLPASCLLVSSDLVRSGPVLLYAAQKGVTLTPRMEGMLGDVRRRALALAGCFHRAARLREGSGGCAQKWDAMGQVPVGIIERIATMARLSIVSLDLVE